MFNLQNCYRLSFFVLVSILIVSFTTYTLPLRAGWTDLIGVSPEVESLAKLKKYVSKLKKLKDNPDKIEAYKLTKKIRKEVEHLSGNKVSVSKGFNEVESIFKKKGIKVSHAQFKAVEDDLKHEGKPQEQQEEVDIPIHVTVGVVLTLCGVFIAILPFSLAKELSVLLITSGANLAGTKLCDKYQENKDKEREKQKNGKYIYCY